MENFTNDNIHSRNIYVAMLAIRQLHFSQELVLNTTIGEYNAMFLYKALGVCGLGFVKLC